MASRFLIESHLDDGVESFYEGIESIQAGSTFELELDGALKSWMYWALDQVPPVDVPDPADQFAQLFEHLATSSQLHSGPRR